MDAGFIIGFMYKPISLNKPTDPAKKKRVLFAALSGFLAGTIAALGSAYINTWIFPELPLYLEWSSIIIAWLLWAVVGGLLAGIAGLSAEGWQGLFFSAVGMAFVILLLNIMQSSETAMLKIVSFVGLLFPIAAMVFPLAVIFYWLANRFVRAESSQGWLRWKIVIVNLIVIVVLGMIPGLYAKMNSRAEQGVRLIHEMLQDAQTSAPDALHKSLLKTEGFSEHKTQPYTLSQAASIYSTVGVDVTVHYKDNYTISCTVILYPGSDPAIFPCKGHLP
jgi:hypothetical protein